MDSDARLVAFWHTAWSLLTTGGIDAIAGYIRSFELWGPLISVALMILQSVLAPLPSWLITGANGAVWGIWLGAAISWVGAMAGAAVTFALARFGRRVALDRLAGRQLRRVDEFSSKHGFMAILSARLLPFVSFDLISYLAGASRIPTWHFLAATGLGMVPGTLAFTAFGHDLARAETSAGRLSLFGLFVVAAWLLHLWWRRRRPQV